MNKKEIEKAIKVVFNETCDKCYFPEKRKCTSCLKENKKKIKEYIYHLEQKKSILDKVTDKLKEVKQKDEKWNSLNGELAVWTFTQEILNIIEKED